MRPILFIFELVTTGHLLKDGNYSRKKKFGARMEKDRFWERVDIAKTALKVMFHIMETYDSKWIVVLARFAFSICDAKPPDLVTKSPPSHEYLIKKGIASCVPNVHCKAYNPSCPCSIFYMMFCGEKLNNFGWDWNNPIRNGLEQGKEYGFIDHRSAVFTNPQEVKDTRQYLVDFGPLWDCDPKQLLKNEVYPLVGIWEMWEEDQQRKKVLSILLCTRRKCPESPFHSDFLPLDMFKIIVSLSGIMPWRGTRTHTPPKLAALWRRKVLTLLLCVRHNCPESPFHINSLPLDIFKVIISFYIK